MEYFKNESNYLNPKSYKKDTGRYNTYMMNVCKLLKLISFGNPEDLLDCIFKRKEFKNYFQNKTNEINNEILKNLSIFYKKQKMIKLNMIKQEF